MTLNIQWGGLHTVISGGQTGADQGGLLAAWRCDVRTGGQAPEAFRVQGGFNPLLEVLGLTAEGDYAQRTKANIRNSDGTVVISYNMASAGTILTISECAKAKKPCCQLFIGAIVEASYNGAESGTNQALAGIVEAGQVLHDFIIEHQISVLNVAGNREMKSDGSLNGTLVVTSAADWIVSMALELLDLDGKLIHRT